MTKEKAIERAKYWTKAQGKEFSVFRDMVPEYQDSPYYVAPADDIPHQVEDWGARLIVTANLEGILEWERGGR